MVWAALLTAEGWEQQLSNHTYYVQIGITLFQNFCKFLHILQEPHIQSINMQSTLPFCIIRFLTGLMWKGECNLWEPQSSIDRKSSSSDHKSPRPQQLESSSKANLHSSSFEQQDKQRPRKQITPVTNAYRPSKLHVWLRFSQLNSAHFGQSCK